MKFRYFIIIGILLTIAAVFFVLGPSQGHIAEHFLTEEQFEEMVLRNDNENRYSTYDESLTIRFSPLNLENIELSFDWCTRNSGFWNDDDSTCYFENQKDLDAGIIALQQYVKTVFGEKENEN